MSAHSQPQGLSFTVSSIPVADLAAAPEIVGLQPYQVATAQLAGAGSVLMDFQTVWSIIRR